MRLSGMYRAGAWSLVALNLLAAAVLAVAAVMARSPADLVVVLLPIQRVVDRRFNRERFNMTHALDAFGMQLRREVDPDLIAIQLVQAIRQTLQPQSLTISMAQPLIPQNGHPARGDT